MKIFIRPRERDFFFTHLSSLSRSNFSLGNFTSILRILSLSILLILVSFLSHSQTFIGVASVPADNSAQAGPTPPAVTPPAGMQAGDLVVIYGQYRSNSVAIVINQAGGQTWNTAVASYSPGGVAESVSIFWCTFNGTWSANPSIRVAAGGTNGLSTIMYVFRPVNNVNAQWQVNIPAVNNTSNANPNVITGVSPTANNSVTMAFWGSPSVTPTTWGTLTGGGTGWSQAGLGAQYRNTTGGQSHTAAYNILSAPGATGNVGQTQSSAIQTLQNIISWTERPANDLCASATSLTSSTTCSGTSGSVVNATYTGPLTDCFGATPTYDVWYSFVAQTTNPTITVNIGATGSNINLPKMQLFSGACGGLTSVSCNTALPNPGSGSINATGLTIGNTYFVRVYSSNAVPTSNGTFTICVVDPAPVNDDCGGAVTLTPGASCVNTVGNSVGATLSTGIPLPICGTPVYDVWYKFVAASAVQTITLSSPGATGANFTNPGIQLLSGACGSLSTVTCATGLILTAPSLTVGATYYVRVYSTSAAPSTNGAFNICIVNAPGNDDCSGAVSLTPAQSCVTTGGTLTNSTNVAIGACNPTRPDVWYTFTAQTVNPTITIGGALSNMRFEVLSGTCGSLTSVMCSGSASQSVSPNLTVGQTYYVRVFSTTVASGNFTICVDDPAPANDACASAVTLTSSTTCNNVNSSVYGATFSAVTITADCAGAVAYDMWYKFVAQSSNPTITLSSLGAGFTNPGMELLSGACGSQTAIMCGTTSLAANYLSPGTTYYIRIYSTTGPAPTSFASGAFSICVVDPVATPPFNDDCANAINLPIWNTCNNVGGNMAGATASAGPGLSAPCAGTVTYDVWYKFTAVTTNANTITLSSLGANFSSSGIQVFSGTCGSLTSIACASGTSVVTPALTVGTVYYIRVFSTGASVPNGNARFNICATTTSAPVRFGNSYVNLSKKTTGGVIMPGDTLEIRFTVNHTSGTMTQLRFVDNVPAKTTMMATANDSIRIITNEGLTYKRYTPDGTDADAAVYKAAPAAGEYNIRLNVGFASGAAPAKPTVQTNAATSANGQMNAGSDNPRGGGGLLFAISYRVKVTGVAGDTVKLAPAQFIYNNGVTDVTLTATPFNILISNPLNLCANAVGLNNAVENGGTFGAGSTLNRSYDLTTPIAGYTFVPDVSPISVVGDGRYAIVKNISPQDGTQRLARRQNTCNTPTALMNTDPYSCANRMFGGFWYVDGDHSGTANAIGNNPPGLNVPSGYMLEVNADYVASEVYRQSLSNLCPNTYYEFSAWVRNICPNCGIDSLGKQFGASAIPADQNGYPGVLPNLTFTLDNLDFYNTGEIDTVGWLKKGFVFKTGPSQTTATFSIRNNAQGGGGNDWVLDDIAIATCVPSMAYSPSLAPPTCQGNALQINDTVRSYFNNYTFYRWQRSTDNAATWNDVTVTVDTTLSLIGSLYQFITSYTIPASNTTLADSGDLYRVIVATSDPNLSNSSCLSTDASSIITLKVLNCGVPLGIDFISFSGKLNHGNADLIWTTSKENEPVSYSVERSYDGASFSSIAILPGSNNANAPNNTYKYTDMNVQGKIWYRIAMINKDGHKKYSRIVILEDNTVNFGLTNVVNPFSAKLDFGITVSENSRIDVTLINMQGNPVRKESFNVYDGANNLTIVNTDVLPVGMYILQIRSKDQVINKKVMKK